MNNRFVYMIFMVLGFVFLRSGYGKIEGGKFVGTLAGTLEKFALQNPYPWYKSFLTDVAIPNSGLFGVLTMWGELFVGLSLFFIPAYLLFSHKVNKLIFLILALGLIGGMFLNGTFWLASGHTSASTDGLNLVMFLIEAIGLTFVFKSIKYSKTK